VLPVVLDGGTERLSSLLRFDRGGCRWLLLGDGWNREEGRRGGLREGRHRWLLLLLLRSEGVVGAVPSGLGEERLLLLVLLLLLLLLLLQVLLLPHPLLLLTLLLLHLHLPHVLLLLLQLLLLRHHLRMEGLLSARASLNPWA